MSAATQADLELASELLTRIKESYAMDSQERRLLLLAKNVCFFVYLDKSAEFEKFMDDLSNEDNNHQ